MTTTPQFQCPQCGGSSHSQQSGTVTFHCDDCGWSGPASACGLEPPQEASDTEVERLRNENSKLRRIAAHVPPRIYIAAKESSGFGTAIVTDWTVVDETVDPTEAKLARLMNNLRSLREYILVTGRPKAVDEKDYIGFAYQGSQWGFSADPDYQAYEALEACEKWLHARLDEIIAIGERPTPPTAPPQDSQPVPHTSLDDVVLVTPENADLQEACERDAPLTTLEGQAAGYFECRFLRNTPDVRVVRYWDGRSFWHTKLCRDLGCMSEYGDFTRLYDAAEVAKLLDDNYRLTRIDSVRLAKLDGYWNEIARFLNGQIDEDELAKNTLLFNHRKNPTQLAELRQQLISKDAEIAALQAVLRDVPGMYASDLKWQSWLDRRRAVLGE